MQIVSLSDTAEAYIWAPQALLGPTLKLTEKILLEIVDGKIISMQQMSRSSIPEKVSSHPCFYGLTERLALLPALIDAHVHLALDGEDFAASLARWDQEEELFKRIQGDLLTLLHSGIGVVRDGGDTREINLKVRSLMQKQIIRGPEVVATGQALRIEGSYGSFLGRGCADGKLWPEIIEANLQAGVQQLKVLVSGIVSFKEYGQVEPSKFTLPELENLVEHAHHQDLKVMAHASSHEAVMLAVKAGVDSIEHGYFLENEALKEMAEKGIAWVPTIIPVAVQARYPLRVRWSRDEVEIISRTYEEQLAKLQAASQMGVPLGLGTDSGAAGVRHGRCYLNEMLLYAAGGLSNRCILQAATSVNANIIGLSEKVGSIDCGKEARLIVVRGNPLQNLNALNDIVYLFMPQV